MIEGPLWNMDKENVFGSKYFNAPANDNNM
jgi:hypothetical protein